MRKFNLKNRIVLLFVIPFLCLTIFGSCLMLDKSIKGKYVGAYTVTDTKTEYVNPEEYMSRLNESNIPIETAYSLDNDFPFFAENQTNSNLCWIYSSLKVLETSLMKQRKEYHNFSEIGSALLYYLNYIKTDPEYTIDKDFSFIDVSGDFADFNKIAQNHGLVYENTFSNDLYYDLDKYNYENYLYVLDDVDTTLMDNVRPINIHGSTTYTNGNESTKISLLKKYISVYGGVFTGVERGIISNTNNTYFKSDDRPDNGDDGFIPTTHAICLVGWDNNKGAFRALNSWGVEYGRYNYFWIPYNYNYIYDKTYGYICQENNNDLILEESSAGGSDGYNASFLTLSYYTMNNLFLSGEDFLLSYRVSGKYDFNKIFVNIYKNQENVNVDFNIDFDDDEKIVTITTDDISKLGSGYYIEFYYDQTYVGTKDFYVFSGADVCYIEFEDVENVDIFGNSNAVVLFNNVFATGDYSETYYHYESDLLQKYYLKFFFPFNNKVDVTVGDIFVTTTNSSGDTSTSKVETTDKMSVAVLADHPFKRNRKVISISNMFVNYRNALVEININVKSTVTNAIRTYKFTFFVSEKPSTFTFRSNRIVYELDGGTNSDKNLTRYPTFDTDTNITAINLDDPVKHGSVFRGWYLDPAHTQRIYKIDSTIPELLGKTLNPITEKYYSALLGKLYSDDIVIYAWWESEIAEYFSIDLNISSVKDYNGAEKDLLDDDFKIIYGDSVTASFVFNPIENDLKTYSYQAIGTYYLNGNVMDIMNGAVLVDDEVVYFENKFLTDDGKVSLVCGTYELQVDVVMVVSHQFVIEKTVSTSFTVNKKKVSANFDSNSLWFEYDGLYHIPVVDSFTGKYAEDADFVYTFDNKKQFETGSYRYEVISIDNENYELEDNQITNLVISRKSITFNWLNLEKVYNGENQMPDYEIVGLVDIDKNNTTVIFAMSNNITVLASMKDVGEYKITARAVSNKNYVISTNESCTFNIVKAPIKVNFDNKSVRFTISPEIRDEIYDYRITWSIEGNLYDDKELLNISYTCQGPASIISGEYPIIGSYRSDNYEVTFNEAYYTVLGHYYVYYTLPDGTEYIEIVESGNNPKGVADLDKSIFKVPFMSKIVYDKALAGNGQTDIYITVTTKSYAWVLYFSIVIFGFLFAYYLASRKDRRNRYR